MEALSCLKNQPRSYALLALKEVLDDGFRAGAGVRPYNRRAAGGRRHRNCRAIDSRGLDSSQRYGNNAGRIGDRHCTYFDRR